jgi:hypothetical protein
VDLAVLESIIKEGARVMSGATAASR